MTLLCLRHYVSSVIIVNNYGGEGEAVNWHGTDSALVAIRDRDHISDFGSYIFDLKRPLVKWLWKFSANFSFRFIILNTTLTRTFCAYKFIYFPREVILENDCRCLLFYMLLNLNTKHNYQYILYILNYYYFFLYLCQVSVNFTFEQYMFWLLWTYSINKLLLYWSLYAWCVVEFNVWPKYNM